MESDKQQQTCLTREDQLEQVQLCMDGGSEDEGRVLQNLEDSSESIPVRWTSLMLLLVG